MKRAIIAVTPYLLLVLFPLTILADHQVVSYGQDSGTCCQDNEFPGRCGRCPDHYAFSLWANYCQDKQACFKRPRSGCQSCVVDATRQIPCQSNIIQNDNIRQYPDPSFHAPNPSPMTHVPQSKDGKLVLPDDDSENELPELPSAGESEIRDEASNSDLDASPPEPVQELDAAEKSNDRSAWRKPSWLRFRSRFGR